MCIRDRAQKSLEQVHGLVPLPSAVQGIHEPERAGEEDALAAWQPVVAVLRSVAHDETVLREVPLDGLDGTDDALVVRGQETDSRDEQEARVEVRTVVG